MIRSEVGWPGFATAPSEEKILALTIMKLTPTETRERRLAQGLCYSCDERFVPGRRCNIRKLFWVEGPLPDETYNEILDPDANHVDKVQI